MIYSEAIGKVILSGEHAVVYGTPAIALPVFNCRARTSVFRDIKRNNGVEIRAKQLEKIFFIEQKNLDREFSPIELTVLNFFRENRIDLNTDTTLEIFSEIPIASGMGSGAAISTSIIRALAKFYNISVNEDEIFSQVFEIEKIYHGNPSGIDPKVIVFEKPFYFVRNSIMEILNIKSRFVMAIIDSGIKSSTKKVVEWVSEQRNLYPVKYNLLFDKIGIISDNLKKALGQNDIKLIGELVNENHNYLRETGVSNADLDQIVKLSIKSGASGSKLSGAGWGGIVISIIEEEKIEYFIRSMGKVGIKDIIVSKV